MAFRAAVFSGCVAFVCALLLLSPLFRVTTVVWTGSVTLEPEHCREVEAASLGQSLLLLPAKRLRSRSVSGPGLNVYFKKHFPGTLEVAVISEIAIARNAVGMAFDASGRGLTSSYGTSSLPELHGFVCANGQLEPAGVQVLGALVQLRSLPALRPLRVDRHGDDVVMTLAQSSTQIRMRITALETQLDKLRVYEHSLGTDELPAAIDLRFRHQVVVRAAGWEANG